MSKVNVRTVVLYDRRRVQPQTLEAIMKSSDGTLIPVDPSELNAFLPINVFLPDVKGAHKARTHVPDEPDDDEDETASVP